MGNTIQISNSDIKCHNISLLFKRIIFTRYSSRLTKFRVVRDKFHKAKITKYTYVRGSGKINQNAKYTTTSQDKTTSRVPYTNIIN